MADRKMKTPYKGRLLMDDAFQKGRAAREAGEPRDSCPLGDYPGRQFMRAWEEGWDSLGPIAAAVAKAVVRPVVQRVPSVTAGEFWPADKPLPTHYPKPTPLPCQNKKCLAVRLPTGSQAVVVVATQEMVVHFKCRLCEASFSLPIAEPRR